MKKLLGFLVALVMLAGVIPSHVMAENSNITSSVVFYDINNNVIKTSDGAESVYAKVTFDAADGVATIIASSYDSTGRFTGIKFIAEEATSPYTTPSFSVSESELIKIIALEDMASMKPLLSRQGALAEAPTATVETLSVSEIAKESDVALSSALNFKADESTKAQLEAYGDWYADFVLTINKDITLNANGTADGYLAGQYDSWSKYWVAVPTKQTELKADEPLRIMATAAEQLGKKGLKYTYSEVYNIVKDFDCGIYFETDFIKANPGLKATLSLCMFNPENEAEYFVVGEEKVFDYTLPEATVTALDVEKIKEEAGVELSSALNFSANVVTPEQLGAYSEWYTDFAITVNKDVTFNATGEGASGYLAGQYDAYSANWLKVPSTAVSLTADDSLKIMETAAELLGKKGLKFTYKEIYDIVKDFNCGIYFNDEFLMENADLEVKLELRLYNPLNEEEYIVVGESYDFQFAPKSVDKFVSNDNLNYELGLDGTVEVKLGEIFAPVNGANISSADLTLSIIGDGCEYIKNNDDWAQSTLKFTGAGQVLFIINDNNNCLDATATVTIKEPENTVKFEKKFDKDFLYRVGNANDVSLSSLFSASEGAQIGTVSVTVDPVDGTGASGVFTENADWKKASIDFNGTGVVKVTITDNAYCIPTELYLEVVNAENITSAKGSITGGNFVLLNDVTLNGYVNYWNSTLYGNGFTYDIEASSLSNHTYQSKQGHGLIIAKNSTIDNLVITGGVYPGYGAYSNQDYYNAAVASEGSTIQNCYISNCSTPIRAMGSTTVKNTTLYGGSVANMYINSGVITLEDVTTVNYNDGRGTLGLGIVVGSDATDNTEIIIEKSLKQYNFIKESDKSSISDQFGRIVIDSMFGSEFDSYKFTVGEDVYVNSGIVSMKDGFNISKIHDNANTGYSGNVAKMNTGTSSVNGYVYSQPNTAGNVDNSYNAENDAHISAVQGIYKPEFHFVLGEQAKEIDSDTYMRQEEADGVITAQYKEGETPLTIDLSKLVSVKRYDGVAYTVTAQCIAPNGSVLADNNGVVTLGVSGDYTLKFTVQDDYIYDNAGNNTGASVTWTYENKLSLNVKAPEAKNSEVSITKTSLDGVYTTVNINDYKLRINFLDAISVKDYKNAASSAETVALTSNIKSATLSPSGVNVFTTASTVTIEYTDGRKLVVELSKISGSSPSTKTAAINTSGGVYFLTDGALNNKPTEAANQNKCTITSVKFTGYSGETVTNDTDVAVTWALGSSSSGGDSCLAEGTLITLADGSKRAVEDLRKGDMVMSYDHVNGELTAEEVIIVVKTTTDLFYKNTFVFDDDTMLTTINEHGIYDLDLNKYVNIDHNNYKEFIGHSFVSVDTEGNLGTKKLVDVICEIGSGYKYDIVTDGTLNYVAEDTLSVTHVLVDVINTFDFANDMTYDTEKMASDIETYGLYSYDEWEDYCDISVFEEYNIPVMKVGISKGMYTKEYIIGLINTYVLDESVQIID